MKNDKINSAIDWFLHSGIQEDEDIYDPDGRSLKGGFRAWYDPHKKEYSYIYPEISGYAITTLLFLYEEFALDECLEKAKITGDWFLRIQNDDGSFPTALYSQEGGFKKPEEYHTFDIGMIFNGLANLARVTSNDVYLDAAKRAADFCITYQKEDGELAAQIDISSLKSVDTKNTWSTQSGAYHAKLAIGLLNIYDQTKEPVYKKSAELLCEYALLFQQPDGQFYTYGTLEGTNLHPHSYATEGLYVAGEYLGNERYTSAASLATKWAMSNTEKGLVPRHKHGSVFNYNERVDILSQVYRLSAIFTEVTDSEKQELLLKHILKYQYLGEEKEQHGGFMFGKLSDGSLAEHVNCWVTQFTLQALALEKGKKLENIFYLV